MNKNYNNEMEEKKSRFNLFDRFRKEREGVSPDEPKVLDNPTVGNFFKLLGRKINTLLTVNLLFVFGNFPIFFLLLGATGYFSIESFSPYYQQFAPLLGASYFDQSPLMASLLGIYGIQATVSVPSTATYILYGLSALLLFTFGPVCVGTTYLYRSMVREEGMFIWSDFWHAIKRNFKQGLLYGIMDLAIMGILAYDLLYFYLNLGGGTMMYIFFFLTFAMCIVYTFMRMYIYLMMITFDLSIIKLLKNALFFSILGIKRNIMALLAVVVVVAFWYVLRIVFFPLAVILPFILMFSVSGLASTYAAYPKIKEIMIDPYDEENRE